MKRNTHEGKSIHSSIARIENIRASVNQMKDVISTLESLVHTFEVTFVHDDQLALHKKITSVIERGNAVAASSRVGNLISIHHSFLFKLLSLNSITDCVNR